MEDVAVDADMSRLDDVGGEAVDEEGDVKKLASLASARFCPLSRRVFRLGGSVVS